MPNTRSTRDELEHLFPEIERFIHLKHRKRELRAILDPMVKLNNHPLKDFAVPSQDEPHSSIIPPAIQVDNFELKPPLLKIVQHN